MNAGHIEPVFRIGLILGAIWAAVMALSRTVLSVHWLSDVIGGALTGVTIGLLVAAAFGSYGWSGEAVPNLTARMQQLKLSMPLEGMRVRFKPTEEDLAKAEEYGRSFARAVCGRGE